MAGGSVLVGKISTLIVNVGIGVRVESRIGGMVVLQEVVVEEILAVSVFVREVSVGIQDIVSLVHALLVVGEWRRW